MKSPQRKEGAQLKSETLGCGLTPQVSHPFKDSSDAGLALLINLALENAEVAMLIERDLPIRGRWHEKSGLPTSILAEKVRDDPQMANTLDQFCDQRFSGRIQLFQFSCMYEVACAWDQQVKDSDGFAATGFLWWVTRSNLMCYRKLETRIVRDIQHGAARCWMTARKFDSATPQLTLRLQ